MIYVSSQHTATLPGWAAQCTCGIETASLQGAVLLTLTSLLYWDGSSCSSWNGKHPMCCFCDAWEEEGKLPVLSCWPTTIMQLYWSWVSLSWKYLLNWESREVTESLSRPFYCNHFLNNLDMSILKFIISFRGLYHICGFPFWILLRADWAGIGKKTCKEAKSEVWPGNQVIFLFLAFVFWCSQQAPKAGILCWSWTLFWAFLLLQGLCEGAASWKCCWGMASCGLSLQAVWVGGAGATVHEIQVNGVSTIWIMAIY